LELAACVVIYAVATLLRGWRWHTIFRRAHVDHAPADAYALTVVAYMGNNVLPARSGELLRVLLLGERTTGGRRVILGSSICRTLPRSPDNRDAVRRAHRRRCWRQAPRVGSAGPRRGRCVGRSDRARATQSRPAAGRLERFAQIVRPFAHATRVLVGWIGVVLAAVTVAVWLLEASIFWLVGDSLDLGINPIEALFLAVLTSFVAIIPSAPGYIDTFEAAVVF
jgi:glycosyltransferase 2 family protein